MKQRWTQRPPGSNWGDFGPDDQRGRMNLLTPARRKEAMKEVITGDVFCLSLPLDRPGGQVLNDHRCAPVFKPVMRGGNKVFNFPHDQVDPRFTDVSSDEAVLIYSQYSTQWDAFAHKGSLFDVDGSGERKRVFYNGWQIVDQNNQGIQGELGARAVSIASMAETGVQGRGVMVNLHRHLGEARTQVGLDALLAIMEADRVNVSEGDILCLHTGLGQLILDSPAQGPDRSIRLACAVLDGSDQALLNWITDSGIVAIAADNLAVESSSTLGVRKNIGPLGAVLPLHEHCLFKLGVHLGELWYLTELANWLHANQRSRFLLTAPPLRLPGAVGSPVTPVATV
jgi:kynurenine formamidase